LLATPTTTGAGAATTQYLDVAMLGGTAATSTTTAGSSPGGGGGGGSGLGSAAIAGISAGAAVISTIAAVGLWVCTKRHHSRQHRLDVRRGPMRGGELVLHRGAGGLVAGSPGLGQQPYT